MKIERKFILVILVLNLFFTTLIVILTYLFLNHQNIKVITTYLFLTILLLLLLLLANFFVLRKLVTKKLKIILTELPQVLSVHSTQFLTELGNDEFGQLTMSFNHLLQEMRENKKTMDEQMILIIHNERIYSMGELLSSATHELNNVATNIELKSSFFKEKIEKNPNLPDLSEQILQFLKKILIFNQRISNIVKSIKNISRNAENDTNEIVNLSLLFDETILLLKDKIVTHNAQMIKEIEPSLELNFSPTQLSQIIIIFVNNALDALASLTEDKKWIKIIGHKKDQNFYLSFVDGGDGIPEKIRSKIMTSFFTTKPKGKGTGLGLSIAKKIVETHGGKLILDTKSKNTKFDIIIPVPLHES